MLTKLIVALIWLTVLTVWAVYRHDRKEDEMLAELEADIFGERK